MNSDLWNKFKDIILKKDKMLLCVLTGILILIIFIPTEKKTIKNEVSTTNQVSSDQNQTFIKNQESRLRSILENMDGVGQVEVMITLKTSTVRVLAKEEPYESSKTVEEDGSGGKRVIEEKSVQQAIIYEQNTQGNENPVVLQEIQPEIEGVFIVAGGGDDRQIQMQITEAVQALFGIEAHKIKIVKRKV